MPALSFSIHINLPMSTAIIVLHFPNALNMNNPAAHFERLGVQMSLKSASLMQAGAVAALGAGALYHRSGLSLPVKVVFGVSLLYLGFNAFQNLRFVYAASAPATAAPPA